MSHRFLKVWAYHDERPPHTMREGDSRRERGWDMSWPFSTAAELADQLSRGRVHTPLRAGGGAIRRGEIWTLALNAHGEPGRLWLHGRDQPALEQSTFGDFREALRTVGLYTRRGSQIHIAGCNFGRGDAGSAMLIRLSRLWPGRMVVGFTRYLVSAMTGGSRSSRFMQTAPRFRRGPDGLTDRRDYSIAAPGRRLSSNPRMTDELYRSRPWANWAGPYAKVAYYGSIAHWPDEERPSGERASFAPPRSGAQLRTYAAGRARA